MDQVTIAKNKFRAEQWVGLIQDCQSSHMKVKDWCATNGVSHHAYYYWLRKLRMQEIKHLPTPVAADICESPTVFKKLEVQSPLPDAKAAVIIHLGNTTVEVNEGTSQQTIQAVLLALQSIC